jgi:hypothetical protein
VTAAHIGFPVQLIGDYNLGCTGRNLCRLCEES